MPFQQYFLYQSQGPRLEWQLILTANGKPRTFLSSETASLAMMELRSQYPGFDYMFYPFVPSDAYPGPPASLHRNCGCGKKR